MTAAPHSARAHARLAPSASHRWMACPGSIRMEVGFPDSSGVFAAEGTAAHELCAMCLTSGDDAVEWLGAVVDVETAIVQHAGQEDGVTRFLVTEEMVDAVQVYLDHVRSLAGDGRNSLIEVEQKLDMTHLHPEIYGTGDAVVYQKNAAWLHVVDFKYGKGVVVDPERNPQLMLYGAGAIRRYKGYAIAGITLHIVQPRAPGSPVRSWSTDVLDLIEFEDEIQRAALRVDAILAFGPDDHWGDDALVSGEHCRFCKAQAVCPAAREAATTKALAEFAPAEEGETERILLPEPTRLSPDQMAGVLRDAEFISNWVKAVQAHAHAEAIAGRMPPGFKLVPKRANRKWKDEAEATSMLKALAVDPWQEPKLKSPAQVESAVGKKRFAGLLEDADALGFEEPITKVSSGLNLVLLDDAWQSVKSDGLLEFDAPDVKN